MTANRSTGILLGLALLMWLPTIWCAARTPLLSDDWSHIDTVAGFASWRDAFDPQIDPLRPVQWLTFHWAVEPGAPLRAHLPGLLLMLTSAGLLFGTARSMTRSANTAALAVLIYASAPLVNAMCWPAAVGWPGRQCGILLGLWAFVAHRRRPRFLTGLAVLLGQVLALLSHESGIFLAPICLAWSLSREPCRPALRELLADPLSWCWSALLAAYLALLLLGRDGAGNSGLSLAATPASLFRAALSLGPEPLRGWLRESLLAGGIGLLPVAIAFLSLAIVAVWALRHGGLARFLVLAITTELLLLAVAADFLQRYAITAVALLAIGLAGAVRHDRRTLWIVAVLVATWQIDAMEQRHLFGQAARLHRELRELTAKLQQPPRQGSRVLLVDLPGELDRDLSVPAFRYGLPTELRHLGLERPWQLWNVACERGAAQASRHSHEEYVRALAAENVIVVVLERDSNGDPVLVRR